MTDHASPPPLSIVLPALNEAASLENLIPALRQAFPEAEIIVVDDGSSDHTRRACGEGLCRVVHNPYRLGNGAAIKRGVRAASAEVLVLMDADGQHTPDHVRQLLERFASADYDMVVGARSGAGQATLYRRGGNHLLNRLASWMTGQRVRDLTSGLRVVKTRRFREFLHLLPNGFSYPTTITMAFFRSGYTVAYEPVEVQQRVGRSHIRPLRDGARFLLIVFKIGSLYSPLKLFLPISLLLFIAGGLLYSYTYLQSGRFTNMSALLFMTSLLTFLIGMVSEQITNLMFARRERQ
jgi:glycosyltransferase involved in cell wall biosynthesis